jgi:hypothetical protein
VELPGFGKIRKIGVLSQQLTKGRIDTGMCTFDPGWPCGSNAKIDTGKNRIIIGSCAFDPHGNYAPNSPPA